MNVRGLGAAALLLLAVRAPVESAERHSEASLGLAMTRFSEFEDTGLGVSASVSRRITSWLAADGALGFSTADLGEPAFSASRLEAFLGVRVGPHLGKRGVFAVVGPGVARLSKAPKAFPCILIYPPPLACSLAGGRSLFGLQLGAGYEAITGSRTVVRVEVGSVLLRYPGPALARDREIVQDSLWNHNLRASISVGLGF